MASEHTSPLAIQISVPHMNTVTARDLRDRTADVLRLGADGTPVTITVNGRPVAEIGPVRAARPQFLAKADLIDLVMNASTDTGLTADLERLAGETTDDLDAPCATARRCWTRAC